MKKLLLSCALALGIGANAQYDLTQGFSSTTGVGVFGAGGAGINSTVFCTAAPSISQTNANSTAGSGGVFQQLGAINQFSNGNKVEVSMSYRKANSTATGTVQLFYAVQLGLPADTSWTITYFGTPANVPTGAVTTCGVVSATIPEGVLSSTTANYGIGLYYTRTGGAATIYYDDLIIKQEVKVAPSCTTFSTPTNGSTISAGAATLSWPVASNATGYKVTVGTTAGASDTYSATVSSLSTSVSLSPNSTYFANITPTNSVGDATGCTSQISFTTNSTLAYCTSVPTNEGYSDGITNVVLTGKTININNPSSSAAGNEYTDYTVSVPAADLERTRSYPLSVYVNTDGDFTQYQIVWFDWNQDGVFSESEKYNLGTATNVSNGISSLCPFNITIPADAVLGKTRMRVRTFYNGANATGNNPCLSGDDGEVEDYSVTILEYLGVNDINKSEISVYPNPFTDVLKISDVKGVKSVSVNDISGREVKSLAPSAELNLSSLKAGLYIVNLKMEDGSVKTFKAIKK